MNINKLLTNIQREQDFEAEVQKDASVLGEIRADRFKRGCGDKRVYTPFSERLQKGISASINIRGVKVRYFMNTRVVSAKIEYMSGGLHVKAVAKCHEEDKFNLKRGVVIATARVLAKYHLSLKNEAVSAIWSIDTGFKESLESLTALDKEAVDFAFKK